MNAFNWSMLHPTQQKILKAVINAEGPVSPNGLSQELGVPIGNVSYHVKVLAGLDGVEGKPGKYADDPLLELSHTEPRRGAVEHFYVATDQTTPVPAPPAAWWKAHIIDVDAGPLSEESFKVAVNQWAEDAGAEPPFADVAELAAA